MFGILGLAVLFLFRNFDEFPQRSVLFISTDEPPVEDPSLNLFIIQV